MLGFIDVTSVVEKAKLVEPLPDKPLPIVLVPAPLPTIKPKKKGK